MKKLIDYRLNEQGGNVGVFIEAGEYYEELSDYILSLGNVKIHDSSRLYIKDYIYLYDTTGHITGRENYSKEEYNSSYKKRHEWNHVRWEDIRSDYISLYDVNDIMSNLDKLAEKL